MKLNIGDVFEFSINGKQFSYGQIIDKANKESLTIIVFDGLFNEKLDLDEIIQETILLMGNTFDAKFYHKHWTVIGNTISNLGNVERPYYKIGTGPIYIEDFKGKKLRKAKKDEIDELEYRSYVAPVRFELALKAHYKIVEWKEQYDNLLYSNIKKVNQNINM